MPSDPEHPHFVTPPDERTWIDEPKNVDRIVHWLYAVCALLVLVDILVPKHGPFAIEHWFGFYAFYGCIACQSRRKAARRL